MKKKLNIETQVFLSGIGKYLKRIKVKLVISQPGNGFRVGFVKTNGVEILY